MIRILIISILLITTSCSPFGGESLIEGISNAISEIFNGESSTTIVSGATQVVDTNAALPAQNFKVTVSVGESLNQSAIQTSDGYTVQTSIQ